MSFWTGLRRPLKAPSFSSYPISSFHLPRNTHSSITIALILCRLVHNYIFYLQNSDTLDIHIPSPQASRARGLAFAPTVAPSTASHSLPALDSIRLFPLVLLPSTLELRSPHHFQKDLDFTSVKSQIWNWTPQQVCLPLRKKLTPRESKKILLLHDFRVRGCSQQKWSMSPILQLRTSTSSLQSGF